VSRRRRGRRSGNSSRIDLLQDAISSTISSDLLQDAISSTISSDLLQDAISSTISPGISGALHSGCRDA
jgi:hypothetical protein